MQRRKGHSEIAEYCTILHNDDDHRFEERRKMRKEPKPELKNCTMLHSSDEF